MRSLILFLLLLAELLVFALLSGESLGSFDELAGYLTAKSLDLVPQLAPLLVLSVGMTLVLITAGIDLSVGSQVALVACLMSCFPASGAFWLTAVPVGLLVAIGLGVFNGLLIARLDVPPIIATLGTMIFFRGLCSTIMQDRERSPFHDVPGFEWLGGFDGTLLVVALVAGAGGVLFGRSRWRRELLLLGGNRVAARYAGVPVDRRLIETYALMGLLGFLAAICFTARHGSVSASSLVGLELKVIVAVVLGGTRVEGGRGSLIGSLLGVLLIGVMDQGLVEAKGWGDRHLPFEISHLRYVALGGLLVLGVWLNTRAASWRIERRPRAADRG